MVYLILWVPSPDALPCFLGCLPAVTRNVSRAPLPPSPSKRNAISPPVCITTSDPPLLTSPRSQLRSVAEAQSHGELTGAWLVAGPRSLNHP